MVAAFVVLIAHSFALTGDNTKFAEFFGAASGVAVDVFFITSGFLVTRSLIARQNLSDFFWARFLRIYPALWLMLLLTVFVLGVFFTSLPVHSYLLSSMTYNYLYKCGILFSGIPFNLPGVFELNPYKNAVNGSLWSMPYEVKCYVILGVLWASLRLFGRDTAQLFKVAIVTTSVGLMLYVIVCHLNFPNESPRERWFFMFFYGATFYCLKEYIKLSKFIFYPSLIALVLSIVATNEQLFVFYVITVAYILFYLAYVPSGFYRKYNQMGDYSYGTYIYAFPVQQSVAALIPGISAWSMIVISAFVTVLLAALSWHFLEHRALGLKGFYATRTRFSHPWLRKFTSETPPP